MKTRLFLFSIVLLHLSFAALAQDVIILRSEKKISAKIIEVSPTQVTYLDFDNQTGPKFVLLVSDIASIIYQNGKIQVFDLPTKKQTQQDDTDAQAYSEGGEVHYAPGEKTPTFSSLGLRKITSAGSKYYIGKHLASDEMVAEYLRDAGNQEAYRNFKSGQSMGSAGGILLSIGGGILLGSIIGIALNPYIDETLAIALVSTSASCMIIGLPMALIASGRKQKALDIHNGSLGSSRNTFRPSPNLYFGAARSGGVGLILRF